MLYTNRKIAAAVMVLLILFGTFFGGYRTLNKLKDEAEQVFYDGVDKDGLGIQNELEERAANAYNLTTLAKRYMDANAPRIEQVLSDRAAESQAKTIAEKYAANERLTESVTELYEALGDYPLSDKDRDSRRGLYANFSAHADIISRDSYNVLAREYNNTRNTFPVRFTGGLLVGPAELFE